MSVPTRRQDILIRDRDQKRLRAILSLLGDRIANREIRVKLQYLQALDVGTLLRKSSELHADLASAALLRFGLDTLATGLWIALVAPDEWFLGQSEVHVPSSLEKIIPCLPNPASELFRDVINRPFVKDISRTLLKDVLNPATHGDALESLMRVGSASSQGWNWSKHLSDIMDQLTQNFVIIIRDQARIDLEANQ